MHDISHKTNSLRTAIARAKVTTNPSLIDRVKNNNIPKGNTLEIARYAAIQAAKNTSQIIPYCHPLPIEFVGVDFQLTENVIEIKVEVKTIYKTGVEMEALTAVSVAALTIYDMLKPFDEFMQIEAITLLSKTGGKSDKKANGLKQMRCAIVVISDSIAAGKNEDKSGDMIAKRLTTEGLKVTERLIVPDNQVMIIDTIKKLCDQDKVDLVITTGGTGLSHSDVTPESLSQVIDQNIPGIVEAMRSYGQARNSFAMLSRSQAGMRKNSLIISFPGSTSGVEDSLNAIFPAVLHIFGIRAGQSHNKVKV